MQQLTSTTGLVALGAGGVALVALIVAVVVAIRLRRLRSAQKAVLGNSSQDLVAHAAALQDGFAVLRAEVEATAERLDARLADAERRLEGAIAYRAMIRYDAYNEMSGRQSTSIALLDASGSGVVLSSIHHREQARLYAKQLHDGQPELELSPEEEEAVRLALAGGEPSAAASG